jgi:3-oxoacyl-[acyl-carrier protein] reductase
MHDAAAVHQLFDLTGRVALVTGAGGDIGRASAEVLSAAGATVVCCDVDTDALEETVVVINAAGGAAVARPLDVAVAPDVDRVVADVVDEHGRLDVLAAIAGTMHDASILDLAEPDLDRIWTVNLKGVLFCCQAAGRAMVAQGSGSIITMASTAVLTPTPGIGPYAITKAAVVQLTRTLAVEIGRKGVRVNAIAPGFVPSKMTSRYYRREDGSIDEALKEQVLAPMRKFAPLRRVGEPIDIAACVLYLASDASSFMTGQLLSPNGGMAMH